ncbi:MAG: aromatic amino acid transaminase [Paracoccaceae bacterium]
MFDKLSQPAPDAILRLMAQFRGDPRPGKIDLGVGVYKDARGLTPVMRAVQAAEERLVGTETTKTYTALAGDPAFAGAMARLVFGSAVAEDRIAACATPGGTGAIRLALDLIRIAAPGATVWVSEPTWPNHVAMLNHLGMPWSGYRYFDAATRGVDARAMLNDLSAVRAGDVVLLHGACHNPTGADPSPADWAEIGSVLARTGAVALIDLAYQGFGHGLDADAAATRAIARALPEVMVAASCSKNFGIYRDRAGILFALSDPSRRDTVQANLAALNRTNFSFPPDHGARIVSTVLADTALTADWRAELDAVRRGMMGLRRQLADELRLLTNSDRFDFIAGHTGMFSRIGASPEKVARLRDEHAIYMVGDSRMNVAGLNAETVPVLARAIVAVGI